ncbi:hypothetical protein ACSFA8_26040 [Variovorax sp. RT4R15]|uniref:hypothetical protein n=1 Tax=Variovorax sp. RT4R15 TaxID=3443737 RepID=UPI003F46E2DC
MSAARSSAFLSLQPLGELLGPREIDVANDLGDQPFQVHIDAVGAAGRAALARQQR